MSEVGSVAEEAALLADALRARAGAHRRAASSSPADAASGTASQPCSGCPVCRTATALHTSGPELTQAFGEAVFAVRGLLRTVRTAYVTAPRSGTTVPERDSAAGEERDPWA